MGFSVDESMGSDVLKEYLRKLFSTILRTILGCVIVEYNIQID